MYSVLHGGVDKNLRVRSITELTRMEFDGHAIGGSVGKDKEELAEIVGFSMDHLRPLKKPIHLLGIGDLQAMNLCIPFGVDSFDSAYPTRLGRHGNLLVGDNGEMIDIKSPQYRRDFEPLNPKCGCYSCKNYTKGYIHHLMKAHEHAGHILGTIHNLHYMVQYMKQVREKILRDEI
eukprot:TRINITY_DN1236_c0_g1_i1.p2 TRINITY_DN1236_c0_g1~~TRINITY_DN1236_c0_g1_i1.p2  ORF type:complete len:176 (+),score=36.75 TRINITY_DN1236_c0_g1_i1:878-1405(+)